MIVESFWTETQLRRLRELGYKIENLPSSFDSNDERNRFYQQIEKQRVTEEKAKLTDLLQKGGLVGLDQLTESLTSVLCQKSFCRVSTPTIMSKTALAKMTIDDQHPLSSQVFWLNDKQCLRPMLAPNLYSLMADFGKIRYRPIRFFEIGSCFRKESDGAKHNTEFTMLNLVEMGTPTSERLDRLKELASLITETAGISDYRFEYEESKVYGETLDVVAGAESTEIASGAMGPHPLDLTWHVTDTWVGLGFGLERLLMTASGDSSITKFGRTVSYLNGIRLKL